MGGKKISDLRVVELRSQLEKRGLDTKGVKATLVERLSQALLNEGESEEDYLMREELNESDSKDKPTTMALDEDKPPGDVPEGEGHDETTEEGPHIIRIVSDSKIMEAKDDDRVDVVGMEVADSIQDNEERDEDEEECDVMGSATTTEFHHHVVLQPEKIGENASDKSGAVVETTTDTTASVPDDDHDALNLTIGEEEDKFMIDGEDQELSVMGTGTKHGTNSTKSGDSSIPANCEKANASSAEINASRSDSIDGKHNEKSEEGGKLHRKSKADDRNTLLVTGLSSQTAATEIKAVFKRHGKIGGVKIMSNAKDPDGSRFALVAVMSSEDALVCIQNLDGFELHGRIIHVDKARAEMLSADWVRKEGNREHSKSKKDSKKSTPNGSTTSSTATTPRAATTAITTDASVGERPASSDMAKETEPVDKERKRSTGQKPNEEITIKTSPKATVTTDIPSASSSDVKPTVKKEAEKNSVPGKTLEKRPSTEKKDSTRKNVIPLQRNYHFQRRPAPPFNRDSRMMRGNPRFRHHEEDSRDEYHHRRPYRHDEGMIGHHHPPPHHRMVRRSRSPPGRMVRRSRSPPERMVRRSRSPPERMVRRSRSPSERMVRRSRSPSERMVRRSHGHSPPERIPYNRRVTPDGRRMGRQPELTFEEIYDTRQREKDREMERERREIERRRLEEVEKQRQLDEEFRRLARERERIEAEKAELKRQKEKMIMEEREKQRLEQAEIEREKALLARKLKNNKRAHLEEDFARNEQKKHSLDDRARRTASYGDTALRMEKEKLHSHAYRRVEEVPRYPAVQNDNQIRGAPLRSAPTRDRRSPSWEKDRRKVEVKRNDRHGHRERDQTKIREDSKFPATTLASDSAGTRYNTYDSSAHYSAGTLPNQSGRIVTAITKPIDSYYSSGIGGPGRGDNRWPASTSTFLGGDTPMITLRQPDPSWIETRDPSWAGSERIATRTASDINNRWGSTGSGSRLGIPAAPPPPIFSTATEELTMNSISGNSFNPNMYSSSYDYKLSSMSSHRR